ncbi:MAG TPA: ATP-binding protein [Actinoplanes sp.]|jgi:predicted ATPase|nr:ATP-binding protein [Actinoplanes sp.]
MTIRRYVLTGAPGAGKTTLADALRRRNHTVVPEAATDVIARGLDGDGFLEAILALQIERERAATGPVQVFDRSPLCTLALARYLRVAPPAALIAHVERAAQMYERAVFLVQPLGFITPTAARRISYADALRFAAVHEDVYREYGFTLVDVPRAPVAERVALVESFL